MSAENYIQILRQEIQVFLKKKIHWLCDRISTIDYYGKHPLLSITMEIIHDYGKPDTSKFTSSNKNYKYIPDSLGVILIEALFIQLFLTTRIFEILFSNKIKSKSKTISGRLWFWFLDYFIKLNSISVLRRSYLYCFSLYFFNI